MRLAITLLLLTAASASGSPISISDYESSAQWLSVVGTKPPPAGVPIVRINQTFLGTGPNGGTSSAVNMTGANFCVIAVTYVNGNLTGVSSSPSNTWTPLTAQVGGNTTQMFYATNATVSSSMTFTATGTSIFAPLLAACYSGVATSSPLDQQNGQQTGAGFVTGAPGYQSGAVTPTQSSELIVAGFGCGSGSSTCSSITQPVASSFSTVGGVNLNGGVYYGGGMADWIQTTAQPANATFTWSGSSPSVGAIASFKAASPGTYPPFTNPAFDMYFNFANGTNGSTPLVADLDGGAIYSASAGLPSVASGTSLPASVTYATAAYLDAISPIYVPGHGNFTGTETTLGIQCIITGSTTSCPDFETDLNATYPSVAEAFNFSTTCPLTASDCGALSGIANAAFSEWAIFHYKPGYSGSLNCFVETAEGLPNVNSGYACQPSTTYRVNLQYNAGTSPLMKATMCSINATTPVTYTFLATFTSTGAASVANASQLKTGISGEEPNVSGYHYNWSQFVLDLTGTKFSTTGCF